MRQFNRESKFGGRGERSSGRRESGGSRDRPFERRESGGREGGERSSFGRKPLEMTKIICDKCGQESEVPFKPSSDKPVYCLDCFRKGNNSDSRRPSYSDRPAARTEFAKPDNFKKELEQINEKLNKIMKALEID